MAAGVYLDKRTFADASDCANRGLVATEGAKSRDEKLQTALAET